MRVSISLLLCALWALALNVINARTFAVRPGYARSEALSAPLPNPPIGNLGNARRSGARDLVVDAVGGDELDGRRREDVYDEDDKSFVELWIDERLQAPDADDVIRSTDAEAESPDNSDNDKSGDEQDFASNPTPISEGRRRAGLLGILGVIALTGALGYGAYTHRDRLKEITSDLAQHLPSVPSIERFKYTSIHLPTFSFPTLSMPTLSARRRTRRRRLRRSKGGYRQPLSTSASRNRTWTDTEGGLLYDYDYDGDYERGPGYDHSESSSSSDSYEAEAFDLGADEDFMIGARRSSSLSSSTTPTSRAAKLGKGMGMERVWGRWKRSSSSGKKAGKKGRRSASGSGSVVNGSTSGTVLFAVAEGDDDDDDVEIDLETDEALPLAPTPHRFSQGLGGLKGYGSAG